MKVARKMNSTGLHRRSEEEERMHGGGHLFTPLGEFSGNLSGRCWAYSDWGLRRGLYWRGA